MVVNRIGLLQYFSYFVFYFLMGGCGFFGS